MLLESFSYYVSVKGRKGGVFSVDFEFSSGPAACKDAEVLKIHLKEDFLRLEALLDELLLRVGGLRFEKTPILTDSPHSMTAGFEYSGRYRGTLVSLTKSLLAYFRRMSSGRAIGDEPEVTDFLGQISAGLSYSLGKQQPSSKIVLKAALGHNLNASALNRVIDLPDLVISSEAEKEIRNVEQIMAASHVPDPKALLESS